MDPRCSECPLNGSPKVYGEEIKVLIPSEEDRDSANPKVLLKYIQPSQENSGVVMVGIAPAEEEVAKGRVYVGISGQILKSALVRLKYPGAYLCNCLLCQIPDDWKEGDSRRDLALECCSGRLLEDIKSRKPRLIVAMGGVPMTLFLGNYQISKIAGRVFPTDFTIHKIAPVLPTLHSAYIWRWPEMFYDFVEQMDSGIRWINGGYQSAVSPNLVVALPETIDSIISYIGAFMDQGGIGSLDLETTGGGFYPYGWNPDQIRCMIISIDNKNSYIIPGFKCTKKENEYLTEEGDTEYENLLFTPGLKELVEKGKWRTWNGQFDAGFLAQIGVTLKIHFDGMLAHYTQDERELAHSLKKVAHKYLGAPDWEEDVRLYTSKKQDTYDKIPNDKLFWYGSHDGIYTNQICERLEEDTKDNWSLHNILLPAANMFNELRHRGIRVDPRGLMKLDENLEVEVSKAEDELNVLCGEPLNPNSPQEVMGYVYDTLKLPLHRRYGRTSNKRALESYLPNAVIEKVLECRHLSKMKSTYIESLAKFINPSEMRLHPFTRLMAAVTGRLATEDPSVMNVVKRGGIMRIYLPEEGHRFGIFDFSGMELRCLALEAPDETLTKILLDLNRDPHHEVGLIAYKGDEALAKSKRGRVKTCVFGRAYGRGIESIMYAERMPREDVEILVEAIDGYMPGLYQYQNRIKGLVHNQGFLVSYFGRYRRFGLLTKENFHDCERQGFNFPIQSMASDVNLLCMLHLYQMREELDITPLWPIHDAIIIDLGPKASVSKVKGIIEAHASELVGGKMIFPVKVKVGDNWGDAIPPEEE